MWLDRLLMLLEILVLLYMLKLDKANHESIQKFLRERTEWYQRRAHQRTGTTTSDASSPTSPEIKRAPDEVPVNETVAVLSESDEPPHPD